MHSALRKITLSQANHVLEGTSHQTRPQIDPVDASLLTGGSDLVLRLPQLTVLVSTQADRPGAWFPGQLGP